MTRARSARADDLDWERRDYAKRLNRRGAFARRPDRARSESAVIGTGERWRHDEYIRRLSPAMQNWMFVRPNAVGASGARKCMERGRGQ